jgi:hypothetical protein
MILHRSRPVLRRLLGRRLAWDYAGNAPRWTPMFWHNPRWTTIRVGSRRHHLRIKPTYAYALIAGYPAARRVTRGQNG